MTNVEPIKNLELELSAQNYGDDPTKDRNTNLYRGEYISPFVDKWDQLIDWDARSKSEGDFFVDVLRSRGVRTVLDVATGTGFHSVRLLEAGFHVTSADGSAAMLDRAFSNARNRGHILRIVQADWRWLTNSISERFDAIVCLGNSFTHLHDDLDRRRVLAEFYSALSPKGILILDQRNYDYMLASGYKSKHKYYYCGDKVSVEPIHIENDLVRFQYTFPDASKYTLNLHPVKRDYTRRLLRESGYQRIRTYGDFEAAYDADDPDFFVHVAEKSAVESILANASTRAIAITEDYYNSDDADAFYSMIWGGDDLHLGIYNETQDVQAASAATVDLMLDQLSSISTESRVIDLGAGYGGSARKITLRYGCCVDALNLSETQNDKNKLINQKLELEDKVYVVHGNFEDIPAANNSYDAVWSQDSFLHSENRDSIFAEAFRVLKPGGHFIFTDPMQSDSCTMADLKPILGRLNLTSLGSYREYEKLAKQVGFEHRNTIDLSTQLPIHFRRIREELVENRSLVEESASVEYVSNMLSGLQHWIEGGIEGHLQWGIMHWRKPEQKCS